MGCDIHLYAETQNNEGKWLPRLKEYDIGRNYVLFGILAGVRNAGFGFPIAQSRGLPEDVSDPIRLEYNMWNDSAHSESWFLLSELLDYNWDKKVFYNDEDEMETLREICAHFTKNIIPELLELGTTDKVRIVFWFDS